MTYTPYSPRAVTGLVDSGRVPGVQELRSRWRRQVLPGLRGAVLDVGAGEGSDLPHLQGASAITLLEPHRGAARRLSQRRTDPRIREVLRAPAEAIPLPDGTVDAALCSAVLCSVTDPDLALAEITRVLRPGGRLVLLEHVAAGPGSWLRRGQRLVAPASRALDRGCDPSRDTEAALRRAPLHVLRLQRLDAGGPWGLRIPHLAAELVRPAS